MFPELRLNDYNFNKKLEAIFLIELDSTMLKLATALGCNDLETLMSSDSAADWVRISEMLLRFGMADFMVEAVVSPLIERITDQLINEFRFLRAVPGQVWELQDKLKWIQSFLRDADTIMRLEESQRLRTVVSQFRDIAYDSEDIIDTYILKVASMRREGRGGFIGFLKKPALIFKKCLYIHKVGNKIETINARISRIQETLPPHTVQDTAGASIESRRSQQGWRRSCAHEEEEHVVGLDDDIDKLVRELNNKEAEARVVSIVGIGGSGKTTLAKSLYNHILVKKHFDCRFWVFISQQWDNRNVLKKILIQTSSPTKEERELIDKMETEELEEKLRRFLEERLYLLVLDDIWETKAWDELSHAFPRGKVGSKLILTTRNHYVPRQADPHCIVHKPRSLTDEEAWELLSKKTKIKEESTSQEVTELCKLGKEMVKRCGGLPLAVVVLGGLLATRRSLQEWIKLHQNIGLQLRTAGKDGAQVQGKILSVLELSYDDLPYRLKPCFLYLGLFPEDADIRAKQVIRMWIAEGFILSSEIDREHTVEAAGEEWLEELIERNMIHVGARDTDGRVKTCRMHDLIRDLCLEKAREENFLEILSPSSPSNPKGMSSINGTDASKIRRIALHVGNDSAFTKRFLLEHRNFGIRSLFYFGSGLELSKSEWETVCANLPLIRVLLLLQVDFNADKLPKQIGNLLHLKHLGLVNCVGEIPQSLGNLQNLQFLYCYSNVDHVNLLPKMEQLRYLSVRKLEGESKEFRVGALKNLRCLARVEAGSWMFRDLQHLTSLERLGVVGIRSAKQVEAVLKSPCITSGRLRSLHLEKDWGEECPSLEPLSHCGRLSKLYISGGIRETRQAEKVAAGKPSQRPQNEGQFLLPLQLQLPPNLTKLTLFDSRLEKQDPLAALEKLPCLKFLLLGGEFFLGTKMTCSANGFPQLQHLQFLSLFNLKEWIVEKGAMPCLRHLMLLNCTRLKTIPEGLRFISSLKELEIWDTREEFLDRLRKVKTRGDETSGDEASTITSQEVGEDFYKIEHIPEVVLLRW
ncbi:Rx, N-terminal [Dillenia turbinata]|uniref:Rx, N-terminal n=1 Tax=Dillenia turbinata TaxID=194707 RepID=A0AAN8W6W8_9MAGN